MSVPLLPISAPYIAFSALLVLYLAYRVTMYRRSHRVGLGDDHNPAFAVEIRAHANAVEYLPISLLLLIALELNGLRGVSLHGLGVLLCVSRAAHAYGFITSQGKYHWGRFWGIVGNWLYILLGAVSVFWLALK